MSSLWIIDLACNKYTNKSLPFLALAEIGKYAQNHKQKQLKHLKHQTSLAHVEDVSYVERGSRKKKWTKHVLSKVRIKRSVRYR